jgi:phage gpG-like protein
MSFNEARKILADLKRFESQLPAVVSEMGAIGQNHFVKSFQKQGFENVTLEKWKPRKSNRADRGKPNRAILVKSGALRRSIRRIAIGKYGYNIVSDLPYAKIHNDGLTGRAYGKHLFKMPKRQFMGFSAKMNNKIERMIDRYVKKVFKSE